MCSVADCNPRIRQIAVFRPEYSAKAFWRASMRNFFLAVLLLAIAVASGFAQDEKPAAMSAKREAKSTSAVPDKALMQKVWDAWMTMDPANPAKYYAKGAGHVFYDITPLKYNSWEEYETGVKQVLAGFQSIKATVNDDAEVHRHGNLAGSKIGRA